jgi:hypothetical protein
VTEGQWLACTDPEPMLDFLRGKASQRKLRLFALMCCQHALRLLIDERSRCLAELALALAEWRTDPSESSERLCVHRVRRFEESECKLPGSQRLDSDLLMSMTISLACGLLTEEPDDLAREVRELAANACPPEVGQEMAYQAGLLRELFATPCSPLPILPAAILAWNDGTVRRIAEGIYEERQRPAGTLDTNRLAILADALLDAGSEDEALIAHCRSAGPHVGGCWAVDLILAKS